MISNDFWLKVTKKHDFVRVKKNKVIICLVSFSEGVTHNFGFVRSLHLMTLRTVHNFPLNRTNQFNDVTVHISFYNQWNSEHKVRNRPSSIVSLKKGVSQLPLRIMTSQIHKLLIHTRQENDT